MNDSAPPRPLAVVTGASSGIGYHLARCAAERGWDLVVCADTPLGPAQADLQALGARVSAVQCDLASEAGMQQLLACIGAWEVDALLANAGHGLGGAFIDQAFEDVLHVIDTNITGTLRLVQHVARQMVRRPPGRGPARILVTGSIAGFQPGSFQAVYNGTKAFLDSFTLALRNELKGKPVTVTCLMPGPTDTAFFERAGMQDTRIANDSRLMMEPGEVARIGFDAMLAGEADVVAGWRNKAQVALGKLLPAQATAEMHRKMAEPGGHGGP